MSDRLANNIAVITGAGSGIGRATTARFVAEGAQVLAVDRNAEGAIETARLAGNGPGRCVAMEQDVTADDAPQKVFAHCAAELGAANILINNAGIGGSKAMHLTDDESMDAFLDVNLRALIRFSRSAVQGLRARGQGGCIINLSSVFGMRGFPGSSVYSATKAAVIGLTQNMAADYGPYNIRVNAIAPGLIETPLTADRIHNNALFRDAMIDSTPLRRPGTPGDIAAAIAFLCSADANFITGQTLAVDGGWTTTKFRPFPLDD